MKLLKGLFGFIWRDAGENNCNAYYLEGSKRVIIDPGHGHLSGHVEKGLGELGVTPDMIDCVIITHGHPDHFEAISMFPGATLFAMEEREYRMIENMTNLNGTSNRTPSFFLQEGDLAIGELELRVLATPGHSPGSLSFFWKREKALFTGDVVFRDGVGRTDFLGGSAELLKASIEKLASLDAELLLPGHGEIIAGKKEVRENFANIKKYWFPLLR
ncbi:MAG: MBL fold metallo-hydrolase [Syntrophales bacterium]|jgi:glyoxylase-like metal-dependent hydrolase (beta-lactamase superfamily II)|nr:MBL fold metallo-hydrolase [Syntrophales bacterium]MDY0044539.1 MBL fold metallo-hydrolase [Syntrophales bacterium]